jgi:hypothetical protein
LLISVAARPDLAILNLPRSSVTRAKFPGTGLSVSAVQSVAHRQLIGSIIVLGIVAAFAALTAFRPGHTDAVAAVNHPFPSVQQPVIEPTGDRLAAIKRKTELP